MPTRPDAPTEQARGSRVRRRSLLTGLLATPLAAVAGPAQAEEAPRVAVARRPRRKPREVTLYAADLPDGAGWGFGLEPGEPTVPGPTLEMVEGETLRVTVVNQATTTVSLHVHGVDYDIDSDGTPMNGGTVAPGAERTYVWRSHAPHRRRDRTWASGSAGYWHYHDHSVGSDHGTMGVQKGLYGALVVRRPGDPLPDQQIVCVFADVIVNGMPAGQAPTFHSRLGDRVEWIMITHGELFHTFHLHGHRWADNRTGLVQDARDESRLLDTRVTGPADSFGFQVIAGERVGPGAWMYHCHVQHHSDFGMAGHWHIADEGHPHH
ncbi:copper oxidase [Vallicoccus soli]|uniref:Copper oxidase n=1 Tax=Vallicoccus soli TaxID=2339232 RepID=A0A3A3YY20_9ACTN|nr:copper oxidase [Vallicoccus soli]